MVATATTQEAMLRGTRDPVAGGDMGTKERHRHIGDCPSFLSWELASTRGMGKSPTALCRKLEVF